MANNETDNKETKVAPERLPSAERMSLAPRSFQETVEFAERIANSLFIPEAFRNKPGDILAAIQYGYEVGFTPMQALQSIYVTNGKPNLYGDAALALVMASGYLEAHDESDDGQMATCTVTRRGHKPHTTTFSVDDARRAGLANKDPWVKYPKRMRRYRALAAALKDKFPDVTKGLITAEEAQDWPEPKSAPTPPVKPAAAAEPEAQSFPPDDVPTIQVEQSEAASAKPAPTPQVINPQPEPAPQPKPTENGTVKPGTIGPEKANELAQIIVKAQVAPSLILEQCHIKALEDLPESRYPTVIQILNNRLARLQKGAS